MPILSPDEGGGGGERSINQFLGKKPPSCACPGRVTLKRFVSALDSGHEHVLGLLYFNNVLLFIVPCLAA